LGIQGLIRLSHADLEACGVARFLVLALAHGIMSA